MMRSGQLGPAAAGRSRLTAWGRFGPRPGLVRATGGARPVPPGLLAPGSGCQPLLRRPATGAPAAPGAAPMVPAIEEDDDRKGKPEPRGSAPPPTAPADGQAQ